jgi:hypothetical protein
MIKISLTPISTLFESNCQDSTTLCGPQDHQHNCTRSHEDASDVEGNGCLFDIHIAFGGDGRDVGRVAAEGKFSEHGFQLSCTIGP